MAGSWLRALTDEVEGQPQVLLEFLRSRFPKAPRESIFVGAGDSYAAAMAGFYASGGRCIALDPYSLASAPGVAEGREVFFISVSGRTTSNVVAAKGVRRHARRTTAITAERTSALAKTADDVVALPMAYAPRTPGMLSFSLSLLSVLKIAGVTGECDFRVAFVKAEKDKRKIGWGRSGTYFLGNSLGYPVSLYAAAKTYELLGAKAHPELLEEFSHLELFSLGKSDVVNIFACFDRSGMSEKLREALTGQRYDGRVVPERGSSDLEKLFHAVFVSQLSVLERARNLGMSEPSFLSAAGRLRASDHMIY